MELIQVATPDVIGIKDKDGNTPFHKVAHLPKSSRFYILRKLMIKNLLSLKANWNEKNNAGSTPRMLLEAEFPEFFILKEEKPFDDTKHIITNRDQALNAL